MLHTDKGPWKIDNGLLRLNEAQDVRKNLTENLGINLTVVDASQRFLDSLAGVTDPEQKRKVRRTIHAFCHSNYKYARPVQG